MEEQKTEKRALTEQERKDVQKSIADSQLKLPIIAWKLKHALLMRDEGLQMNFEEAKFKINNDIAELTRAVDFEKKVIAQYTEVLSKNEIELPKSE